MQCGAGMRVRSTSRTFSEGASALPRLMAVVVFSYSSFLVGYGKNFWLPCALLTPLRYRIVPLRDVQGKGTADIMQKTPSAQLSERLLAANCHRKH